MKPDPHIPPSRAWTALIPARIREFILWLGDATQFAGGFFRALFSSRLSAGELARQCYALGFRSLALVGVTGFIIGMVITLQSLPSFAEFGAKSWIPSMVGVSIVREIGPVLTALICAGKLASGISAEIGAMRVSDQIDAMELSGCRPFSFLVVTRVLAATLMVPLLVFYADAIAFYGSYMAINFEGEIPLRLFMSQALEDLTFADILPATLKTFGFGFIIGIVGCHAGYTVRGGTPGVGRAVNTAVVVSSLLIFVADLLVVQITQLIL